MRCFTNLFYENSFPLIQQIEFVYVKHCSWDVGTVKFLVFNAAFQIRSLHILDTGCCVRYFFLLVSFSVKMVFLKNFFYLQLHKIFQILSRPLDEFFNVWALESSTRDYASYLHKIWFSSQFDVQVALLWLVIITSRPFFLMKAKRWFLIYPFIFQLMSGVF